MSKPSNASGAPGLSIVIPAPADTSALEETLVSVLENRPDDCEIVVALGCEYADPWNIREEVRFVQAPRGSSLVGCTNLGIAASTGRVIHVLAAGWRATEGWTDKPVERLTAGHAAAVVPLGVSDEDHDLVVSAGLRHTLGGRRVPVVAAPRRSLRASAFDPRSVRRPTAPVLEAGFWSAELLTAAGPGFATACGDALADADMAAAVGSAGGAVVLEPESRVVCGAMRARPSAFVGGLQAERLFWRSLGGRAVLAALVAHAVEIVRHSIASAPLATLPMLVGRLVGIVQFGAYVPRARQLAALRQGARSAEATASEGQTLRIDEAHERAGRAPRHAAPAPLKRSA